MYIPGEMAARLFILMVFPPPKVTSLLVFRMISPVIEIRLTSKLPADGLIGCGGAAKIGVGFLHSNYFGVGECYKRDLAGGVAVHPILGFRTVRRRPRATSTVLSHGQQHRIARHAHDHAILLNSLLLLGRQRVDEVHRGRGLLEIEHGSQHLLDIGALQGRQRFVKQERDVSAPGRVGIGPGQRLRVRFHTNLHMVPPLRFRAAVDFEYDLVGVKGHFRDLDEVADARGWTGRAFSQLRPFLLVPLPCALHRQLARWTAAAPPWPSRTRHRDRGESRCDRRRSSSFPKRAQEKCTGR